MSAPTTITGNLVEDPELRYTPNGHAVVNFRVATSERLQDRATGEWRDSDPTYFTVTAWRKLAENIAESLRKGDQVVIAGRMRQRGYETESGERRTRSLCQLGTDGRSTR